MRILSLKECFVPVWLPVVWVGAGGMAKITAVPDLHQNMEEADMYSIVENMTRIAEHLQGKEKP